MRLVLTFTEAKTVKVQDGDDDSSGIMGFSASSPTTPLLQLDYPLVKYWERKVWKAAAGARKDTSEVQTKNSTRGGTRSSQGENVMMLYIEDANGIPIDGNTASGMRDFARSIWRSLYERGIAPETWGQATKEIREEYCGEMEREYHVLRFCNNHWKANALATAIYSQWYRTYKKIKPCPNNNDNSESDDGSNGPPRKKARTTIVIDDDTQLTLPEPETHANNKGMSVNITHTDANNSTEISRSNSDVQCVEDSGSLSHHGTALKDPLYVTA